MKQCSDQYEEKVLEKLKNLSIVLKMRLSPYGRRFLKALAREDDGGFLVDWMMIAERADERTASKIIQDFSLILKEVLPEHIAKKITQILTLQQGWSYSQGYLRRSFRSDMHRNHLGSSARIVSRALFFDWTDFELSLYLKKTSIEKEKTPQLDSCILSSLIALELDTGNQAVIDVIRTVCLENEAYLLNHEILDGIAKSRNHEMITLLGQLLLAARLQEGLRQAILECADQGSIETFSFLMKTVLDHNLLRFSSAQRAVGTWMGLGYGVDDQKITENILRKGYTCVTCAEDRIKAYESDEVLDVYASLWATCVYSIRDVAPLLKDLLKKQKHHQLVALSFLKETDDPAFQTEVAIGYLGSDDTDIQALAFANYALHLDYWGPDKDSLHEMARKTAYLKDRVARDRDFAALTKLFHAIPSARYEIRGKPFPWSHFIIEKNDIFSKMMIIVSYDHDPDKTTAMMLISSQVDGHTRERFLEYLIAQPKNQTQRDFLFNGLTDKSMSVRQGALHLIQRLSLTEEETHRVEAMLSLKTGGIRQTAIALLLGEKKPLASIRRLLEDSNENRRLAGLDMLAHKANDISAAEVKKLLTLMPEVTDKEKVLVDNLSGANPAEATTAAIGFGLYDPDYAPDFPPPQKNPDYDLHSLLKKPDEKLVAAFASLCNLVEQHKDYTYAAMEWDDQTRQIILGAEDTLVFPTERSRDERTINDYVLPDIWKGWVTENKYSFEQLFSLSFYSEITRKHFTFFKNPVDKIPGEVKEIINLPAVEKMMKNCRELPYNSIGFGLLALLIKEFPEKQRFECMENALLDLMVTLPDGCWKADAIAPEHDPFLFIVIRTPIQIIPVLADYPPISNLIEAINKMALNDDQLFERKLKLFFQLGKLSGRHHIALDEVDLARGVTLGALEKDCLLRHFMDTHHFGSNWFRIYTMESGRVQKNMQRFPVLSDAIATVVKRTIEIELDRGDTRTEVSELASNIEKHHGAETFVRILVAMAGETFARGYIYSNNFSKREVLSHLLKSSRPAPEDHAEKLKTLLAGHKISEKRLVEAALYAPAWTDIVGQYLGWPGFKSAAWYFHAHTSQDFSAEKETEVARFSAISPERFNDGAFDAEWFKDAHQTLGAERFDLLYSCARYISEGSMHRRAQLFADAMLHKLDANALEKEITEKRNKDRLLAYSIIPINDTAESLKRYEFIQNFLKESKKFGAQRRESEKKTTEIALENLARNAGFPDTNRFIWQMEKEKINAISFEPIMVDNVSLCLVIDDSGWTDILCIKNDKPLKSVPSRLNKNEQVVRLKQLRSSLREQLKRARVTLESAMIHADPFLGSELRTLQAHPVIAPLLNKLVFQHQEKVGFFVSDTLVGIDNDHTNISDDDQLVVAHPSDLFRSGQWSGFQKLVFEQKMVQPFKQIYRELYRINEDESQSGTVSKRYAGHQVQPKKTLALLRARGWTIDNDQGLQKVYYRQNIIATIYAAADWFSPADIECPTLENIRFYDRHSLESVAFKDIPDNIFSETMRDMDLVVSVAHAGGVDPEASYSTVEMRRTMLPELLALLKVQNVTLRENHAVINGTMGEYTVHLGSGSVHQMGRGAIHILAVPSQHRGRLFLPFADDDPRTADILSRILLLSNDKAIKDPSILSQIQ